MDGTEEQRALHLHGDGDRRGSSTGRACDAGAVR